MSKPEPDPDQDTPFDFPEHRLSVAGHQPPPQTIAACSVWALATTPDAQLQCFGTTRRRAAEIQPLQLCRVERDVDRIRVVRLRPEETDDWAERERIRRAKQKVPPPKWKKSRGERLQRLIAAGLAKW